jgi:hypothetical protein
VNPLRPLVLMMICAAPAWAQQPPGGVRVDARLGLSDSHDDVVAGWSPVDVTIENGGPARTVELVATLRPSAEEAPRWRWRQDVALSQGQRWRGWLYVPASGTGELEVTVWPQAVAGEERPDPLARAAVIPFAVGVDRYYQVADRHVVCVGDRLELRDVSWLARQTQTNRWNASPTVRLGLRAPDALPDRAEGYHGLELVVLRDADLSGLSPAQQEALLGWVQRGGRALLIPGRRDAFFRDPIVAQLLGGRDARLHEVTGLPAIEAVHGELGDERFLVFSIEDAADLDEGGRSALGFARRLPDGGAARFFTRLAYGRGQVMVLAADPMLPPFDRWAGREGFTDELVELLRVAQAGPRAGEDPFLRPRIPALLGVRRLPSRGLVIGLVLLFIICVGPVNYLLLRRRDAQMLLVVTVPALSFLWTGLIFATGYLTKGVSSVVQRATIVDVDLGARTAAEQHALAITSGASSTFEVAFEAGLLATRVGRTDVEAHALTHEVRGGEGVRYPEVPLGLWAQAAFHAERTRMLPGALTATRSGDTVTLENGTGLAIVRVIAFDARGVLRCGALPAGGQARLERGPPIAARGRGAANLATELVPEPGDEQELARAALDLYGITGSPGGQGLRVIALLERAPSTITVEGDEPGRDVALLQAWERP